MIMGKKVEVEWTDVQGIVLSGYGMEDDLESTAAAGFHTHLTKPVEWSSLEDALRRVRAESE